MDVSLPSVSDPSFVPDMDDDCNEVSRSSFVNPEKMQELMKKTAAGNQFCPNTNPYAAHLKNQDKINQDRKKMLTDDPNLLSTTWCPIKDFDNGWINFVETHLHHLIRLAGCFSRF